MKVPAMSGDLNGTEPARGGVPPIVEGKGFPQPGGGYSVWESTRAKRVILRVLPHGRLEVVVPNGFDRDKLPAIVLEHAQWIEKAVGRMASRGGGSTAAFSVFPPEVNLRAVGLCLGVRLIPTGDRTLRLSQRGEDQLELTGKCTDTGACILLLRRWLRHQGRLHLIPWLENTAGRLGMSFRTAQIRSQKTRWGSCSSRGTISLNDCLLFLPRELVCYIMVHELCHTRYLNHSQTFWRLVASHAPDFQVLDARMKEGRRFVPSWAGGEGK